MTNNYQIISESFKGNKKRINEDGAFVFSGDEYFLLALLDGVGSAQGAKKTISFTKEFLSSNFESFYTKGYFDLGGLLKQLNQAVLESNIDEPYSTCVLMYLPRESTKNIKYVSLGDSRIYSVGKQYFSKLTKDHSLPGNSNVITKYLGKEDLKESDYKEYICSNSEKRFFLCTDGVYNQIESFGEELSNFHNVLFFKYLKRVQDGLKRYLYGNNVDDASYIYVRLVDV